MRNLVSTIVLSLLVASSCTSVYRPKQPIPPGKYSKQILADVSDPNLLKNYNSMAETTDEDKAKKVARRNQILEELLWLIDQNYYSFEDRFYTSQRNYEVKIGFTAVDDPTQLAGHLVLISKGILIDGSIAQLTRAQRGIQMPDLLLAEGSFAEGGVLANANGCEVEYSKISCMDWQRDTYWRDTRPYRDIINRLIAACK